MPAKKFNYIIGRYWEGKGGAISAYMMMSSEVFFGTEEDAEKSRRKKVACV
jgi:hypothetical protein